MAVAAAAAAGCTPDRPDLVAGERGRIARISDGDLIALDTGLRVRLAEVEAPSPGYRDRPDAPYSSEATRTLAAAALGREATLWYGGPTRDRYERAIAHVIAADEIGREIWLNGLMVREGAARVRTFPDNARRARALLALEEEARSANRGLWALPDYRVLTPQEVAAGAGDRFAIVEGMCLKVRDGHGDGRAFIDASGVAIAMGDRLGPADPELALEAGRLVRVRGRVDGAEGERHIRLTHWAQVETPRGA